MNSFLLYLQRTLKDPSTYAGIGILANLLHITLPGVVTPILTIVGGAACGIIAILVPSAASPPPAS